MAGLRDLLELVRAPAALSVPGDVLAGAAAGRALGGRTAGLACSSVCLYWAGMAANDWADRHLDAVERPERPIPSGRVAPGTALGVATGLTVAGLALAGLTGGRRALAVAVPLAGAVWAYDLAAKNTRAGPAAMALCRGLDVLLGAAPGRAPAAALPAALSVAAHTYLLTALSRGETAGTTRRTPATTLTATLALTATVAGRPTNSAVAGRPPSVAVAGCPTSVAVGGRAANSVVGRLTSTAVAGRPAPAGGAGAAATAALPHASEAAVPCGREPVIPYGPGPAGMPGPASNADLVRRALGESFPAVVRAGLALWYAGQFGSAQTRAVAEPTAARVRDAVTAGIVGLPALQGALAAQAGAPRLGLAIAAAVPVARRLARKLSPT
ncbi:SCO3242 family prenyltransferase [Nonomuraea fuscirosea]|uniref:SCO3242 family prenyltransferase n=1 Tax=Nonomuraea fuscirosea TaxID=1291556 RepID=UPI0033E6AD1C